MTRPFLGDTRHPPPHGYMTFWVPPYRRTPVTFSIHSPFALSNVRSRCLCRQDRWWLTTEGDSQDSSSYTWNTKLPYDANKKRSRVCRPGGGGSRQKKEKIYAKYYDKNKCIKVSHDGATHPGKPGVHSHVPVSGHKGISQALVSTCKDLLLQTNDARRVPLRFPDEPVWIHPQKKEGLMAMSSLQNNFCQCGNTTLSRDCRRIFPTRSGQRPEEAIQRLATLPAPVLLSCSIH